MDKIEEYIGQNPFNEEDTMAKITAEGECQVILYEFVADNTYTISFYVKGSGTVTIHLEGETLKSIESTDEWQRVELTFQATKGKAITLGFTEGTYYVYNTMLERGNLATDYEKAPNDITEEYTSKISQTADTIMLEVDKKVGVDEVEEKVSEIIIKPEMITLISDNIELNGNTTIGEDFILTATNIDSTNLTAEKIEVKDSNDNIIFKADAEEQEVTIGGYTVSDDNLSATKTETSGSTETINTVALNLDGIEITYDKGSKNVVAGHTQINGSVKGDGIEFNKKVTGTMGGNSSSYTVNEISFTQDNSGTVGDKISSLSPTSLVVNASSDSPSSDAAYIYGGLEVHNDGLVKGSNALDVTGNVDVTGDITISGDITNGNDVTMDGLNTSVSGLLSDMGDKPSGYTTVWNNISSLTDNKQDKNSPISRTTGGTWITGRDNAVAKQLNTAAEGQAWSPVISVKTQSGNWTLGSVGGETLCLSYDTDANYNVSMNYSNVINFPTAGSDGTLALKEEVLNLSGGTLRGGVYWASTSLPSFSGAPSYLLGIESFANGGQTKWQDVSQISVGSSSYASYLTSITSNDQAGSSSVWRRIWMSYSDNTTGRPAYYDGLVYQTNTNTFANGIGTSSSNFNISVNNANTNMRLSARTWAGLYHESQGSIGAGWLIYMNTAGNCVTNNPSDIRYKNDLGILSEDEALALLKVEPHIYTYKVDDKETVYQGFIAQDMVKALKDNNIGYRPFLIVNDYDNPDITYENLDHADSEVRYGLDYAKFTPILFKGWQIHEQKIADLEKENEELKAKCDDLETRLAALEKLVKGE